MGEVTLNINGTAYSIAVPSTETLLTTLRDRLGLTGTKRGCNQGVCGACTVAIDDVPMRACLSLSANCARAGVRTIEGYESDRIASALVSAFERGAALQCGFCSPGMIVVARELLARNPTPSETQIREGLAGNLCRCTGYQKIVSAVLAAADELQR